MKKTIFVRLLYVITAVPLIALSDAKAITMRMTENSSTDLTVKYSYFIGTVFTTFGADYKSGSPDVWNVVVPVAITFDKSDFQWLEPESSALINKLTLPNPNVIVVNSDTGVDINFDIFPDASAREVGNESVTGTAVTIAFTDNAQSSEAKNTVPENTATAPLLILSLIPMFGVARLRMGKSGRI